MTDFNKKHDGQCRRHHHAPDSAHGSKRASFCVHDDDLYGLMRACGHYLYHRSGKDMGQKRILAILHGRESMTQKELQEMLQIQPGSVSEILSKLEEKGFIVRKKDENDRRKSVLKLTEAGQEAFRAQKQHREEKALFCALGEAEQKELERLLRKLLASWD